MAKQGGLGSTLWVDGYDVSGDTQNINEARGGFTPIISTAINQSAQARLSGVRAGKRDGLLDFVSYWNPASNAAHDVYSPLPTSDRIGAWSPITPALGGTCFVIAGKQINYDGSRAADGGYTLAVNIPANTYGAEWGRLHTAGKRTDTAATNGSSVDWGAAGSFGLQAWLQVFSFTGTDATVKLQQSSDNGAGDAFADVTGGAFTQITTAPTSQRIETARDQAVERYLRVVTTTSGGFSSLVFGVVVTVNATEVQY